MSEIRAIESNKHPVYTFQGKDKTLELPMEITFIVIADTGNKSNKCQERENKMLIYN